MNDRERPVPSRLLRAFRLLCDSQARDDIDLAMADISKDIEEQKRANRGPLSLRVLILWKVLGTMAPIAWDGLLRFLRSGLGLVSIRHALVAGDNTPPTVSLRTRDALLPIGTVFFGLSAAFLALSLREGLRTRVDGVVQEVSAGQVAALYAPHVVVYAMPLALLFGLLVAGRRSERPPRSPDRRFSVNRAIVLGAVLLSLLEGAWLFNAVPRVNERLVEIVSEGVVPERNKGVREMSGAELIRTAQDPASPTNIRRMASYEIHMKLSFAAACLGFALLGLFLAFLGPRRAVLSYAAAGASALLWFFSLFPIQHAVNTGEMPSWLAWLPTLGICLLAGLLLLRDRYRRV